MKTAFGFVAAMTACSGLAGGCVMSDHHGPGNAWFTLSKYSDDSYLQVLRDFSYEYASPVPGSYRRGRMDDAAGATLQDLLAPESVRRYIDIQREIGWDDSCWQEGVSIRFWSGGAACWIPSKVTDEATTHMLEYLLALYERLRA